MAALQLLFLLLASCVAASVSPRRQLSPCQVVQHDVFCSNLNLRGAPLNLPHLIQMLDLSQNRVQNLTQETLAFHTGFHHLNLHTNKIHFIQPGLFKDMTDLRVLDLSRNHLNVVANSRINIGPLTAVESLDLSGNGLSAGMTDYFLADSPALTNLSLNSNSITKIAQNTFSGSLSLRKISFHNNVILEIEDGAFEPLDNLTELDLSKNSIMCIKDFNLYNLVVLNLNKNSIDNFQSTQSSRLFKLRSLDLSENKMLDFPLLPETNMLEYLDISRNQLHTINVTGSTEEETVPNLSFLRFLDMSYNQLQSVPESFFSCMRSLEFLNISKNCISSFSVTNEDLLRRVKVIDLSYNSLQTLNFKENSLQCLEKLFLQGNDLTVLDHQIFQRLPNIRCLQLQQNNLKICDPEQNQHEPGTSQNHLQPPGCVSLTSVKNLLFLNISENNLRSLCANAFVNTPLKLLDLSFNPGLELHNRSLAGLDHSLVHIFLKDNNISSLNTELSSLKSIKHVDLSTNQLSRLPRLHKDSSVESLNVQNNNLVTLDHQTIRALEHSLKTLYMGSNPLSCCENIGFLHMVRHSRVVVPDIEAATCIHDEHSEPISIENVTKEMCHRPEASNYIRFFVVLLIVALVCSLVVVVVKCCHLRRQTHMRSFYA
ncbi:transforming growth factor beta activator LRRC32 [Xenentodon cancila]